MNSPTESDYANEEFSEFEEDEDSAGNLSENEDSEIIQRETKDSEEHNMVENSQENKGCLGDSNESVSDKESYNKVSTQKRSRRRRKKKTGKKNRGKSKDSSARHQPKTEANHGDERVPRTQSAYIMSKRFVERNTVKKKILDDRQLYLHRIQERRLARKTEWSQKLSRSPFKIDLLADNERLEEENRIQLREEQRLQRVQERRKEKIKNDIILKALYEANDLDALRAEKRMIVMEEKRLKAMLGVEKSKSNKKQDMMAAVRAEKLRQGMRLEYRRQQRRKEEEMFAKAQNDALKEKLGLA